MSYLGLDIGAHRIGVAVSRSGIIAEPLTTLIRSTDDQVLAAVGKLVETHNVSTLVIGVPNRELAEPASTHPAALFVRFARLRFPNLSIQTVDETLTTKEAERLSRPGTDTDALAAALILEQYLVDHD